MDKWDIRATPSADDPDRHLLLIQGGPTDVAALLKKFGALMGRPSPAQVDGFNLSLVLHKLKPAARDKLDAWLRQFAPPVAAPEKKKDVLPPAPLPEMPALAPTPPMPTLAPTPPMPTLAPTPPMPTLAPPPPMPALAPPPPMPTLTPPVPETPSVPAFSLAPAPVPTPAPAAIPEPATPNSVPQLAAAPITLAPATAPVLGMPVLAASPDKPALVSLSPEPVPTPVPTPAPMPAFAPAPETIAAPVTETAPATTPGSLPPPPTGGREYSIAVSLRPEWTMESMLVGAYNRFAHAAVMSVVTSPGTMYNPLFLYGIPGTGKSHMLNAIGATLSKGLGGSVLLSTSGSRLSRAVNTALARKTMPEIEARIAGSKALLIDDLHLIAISDQNKDALAKIFKSFFDRKAQVVITSLYPPRSLGALEEALKFSFSKGWSVDLKVPNPTTQKEVVGVAADRTKSGLGADEISLLHEKLSQSGYSDMSLWLRRAATYKRVLEKLDQPSSLQVVLNQIYEPVLAVPAEAPKVSAPNFQPPTPPPDAEPLAVIAPKGVDGLGAYVAAQFYENGKKNGFPQVYRHVLWEFYDPAMAFGVPFMIGEMCHRAGVTRALVVGPPPASPLGPRSTELAHATRRILESFEVEMGWIPYVGLQVPAHYLNAHLDFARSSGGA
jgi:hypothetical protein